MTAVDPTFVSVFAVRPTTMSRMAVPVMLASMMPGISPGTVTTAIALKLAVPAKEVWPIAEKLGTAVVVAAALN